MKEIVHSERLYRCPVTTREETLSIRTTTLSVKSRIKEDAGKEITRKKVCIIMDCTGLHDCDVRIVHGNALSHDWSQCPAMEVLKTS